MTTYDPPAHGALCGLCPLRERREGPPCPPEARPGATYAIVGEAPGGSEVEAGRPFVGASGVELARGLKAAGLSRRHAHVTNVLLCRPPKNDLKKFHATLTLRNRRRKAKGLPPWPLPELCCAPRLAAELEPFDRILPLGDAAAKAVVPHLRAGITATRGGPVWAVRGDGDGGDDATDAPSPTPVPATRLPPAWTGWEALTPEQAERVQERGAPPPGTHLRRILPTFHPAFVLRYPRFRTHLDADLPRARRLFQGAVGALTWRDPQMVFHPTVAQVRRFLLPSGPTGSTPPYAFDFETDAIEPLACTVRCLGVGTDERVMVIPFGSCEPDIEAANRDHPWRAFYSDGEYEEIRRIVRAWALNPRAPKTGWNSGYYDALVFLAWLGVPYGRLAAHTDGILAQRLVEPALSHSLADVGSRKTDAWRWKGGKEATTAKDDRRVLWPYNARDVAVTASVVPEYVQAVKAQGLSGLLALDHEVQEWCRGMHVVGMQVDQEERERLDTHYSAREAHWRGEARRLAHRAAGDAIWGGRESKRTGKTASYIHNPGSPTHVARLLFDVWKLQPTVFSEVSGIASVGDSALRGLQLSGALTEEQADYIHAVRRFRANSKIVSANMAPLRPLPAGADAQGVGRARLAALVDAQLEDAPHLTGLRAELLAAAAGDRAANDEAREALRLDELEGRDGATKADDAAGSFWDLPESVRTALIRRGIVHADGRIHADWKAHVVPTGRLASSPNLQNVAIKLRSMFVAALGHRLITADAAQIEFRVAASRWGAARYLEAFERGWDTHQVTMHLIYGDAMWQFPGWIGGKSDRFFKRGFAPGSEFERHRDLSKRVQYAAQYGAAVLTVFDVISSAEDKYGRLLYPKLTVGEVATMVEKWQAGCPEFIAGWQREIDHWKTHGFIREDVTGRRWTFPDGEDLNKMVNAPIQGSAAGLVNLATRRVVEAVPFFYAGPDTGLCNQGHDALTLEVPEADAPRVEAAVVRAFAMRCPALPGVRFMGDATSGPRWKPPKELVAA